MNPDFRGHKYPDGWNAETVARVYATKVAYETASKPEVKEIKTASSSAQTVQVNNPIKEGTIMCQSVLNKLTGIAPGHEKLVALEQAFSKDEYVTLDLAAVLGDSAIIKGMKPGEDCLIKGVNVDMNAGRLGISVATGKVTKTDTAAVLGHFKEMLLGK